MANYFLQLARFLLAEARASNLLPILSAQLLMKSEKALFVYLRNLIPATILRSITVVFKLNKLSTKDFLPNGIDSWYQICRITRKEHYSNDLLSRFFRCRLR